MHKNVCHYKLDNFTCFFCSNSIEKITIADEELLKYIVILKYFSRITYLFLKIKVFFGKEQTKIICVTAKVTNHHTNSFRCQNSKIKLRHWIWSFALALVPLFVNAVSYNQSKSNYKYCNP